MAVIGKIRERSGLLLVIVGGALAAFILTDLFSNRGGGPQDQVLGTVGGEPIGIRDYERRVNDELESYRNDFGQQVNQQMTDQVRTSVWNEMVTELVMLERVKDAGFGLTKPEYDDIRFGQNILPDFRGQPNFQGTDGQPDREKLMTYFTNVQVGSPVYHEIQKRRITQNRLYSKYNNLVKQSVFVNKAQAQDEVLARNEKVSFNFVAQRYDNEPDSLHVVSEKELRQYYDKNKGNVKYRQKPSRRFEYVLFPVAPSTDDRERAQKELDEMRDDFMNSANDSLFVIANSDERAYMKAPYAEGSADALHDGSILNASVGEVVGPYVEGDSWKLVKVAELADVPEARVRHILLSTQKDKSEDEQRRRADSLLTVVKRDRSKFEDLVSKFSDDPGSVSSGGVYEWFDKQRMVPEFTAASFDEKVGAITIAKTSYGFHIVEVLGQRTRQERRVVSITRAIKPSPATFKEVYKKANDFSLRNKQDIETFRKGAEEMGLGVTPVEELRPDVRSVAGLQQPNTTISWVNRAKVGEVSEPMDAGDNYVVAMLTRIRLEGVPELEDVKDLFTREAMKAKKAEAIAKRMEGKTDLNVLASELGVAVQTASDMALSSFSIPGGYAEYEVVGKIMALKSGQTSVPLKGDNAVYVVNVTGTTPSPEITDLSADRSSLQQRLQSRVENGLSNALRESMGVKDDRSLFY